jgi:REP-associated tyrosine transposase
MLPMARLARIVIPGTPYHVTQRGNRRQPTFFEDGDFALYRDLLAEGARRAGASVWAYCLMPNHVHVIVVPADPDGLRATFAHAHRRYTGFINARHRWTGHLWQGRFGAVAMDERHLAAAARYVALNPVRARLVSQAEEWEWSSVRAHLAGRDDGLVSVEPLLERYGDFGTFLGGEEDQQATRMLRRGESTGRPAGSADWLRELESATGRALLPRKPGRKPRESSATGSQEISALWRLSP